MIRRLAILGLGPHQRTTLDLDPAGASEITGRSESGKTTAILDGVAYALWGVDRSGNELTTAHLHQGADQIEVEVTTAKGTVIRRALRWDSKGTRVNVREIGGQPRKREDDFRAALGSAARRDLRFVLVPMAWHALMSGAHEGAGLRDLLVRCVVPLDERGVPILAGIIRELVEAKGQPWRDGDPVHGPDAEDLRRQEKRRRDELTGSVRTHRETVALATAHTAQMEAGLGDVEALQALVKRCRAWAAFSRAHDDALDVARRVNAWIARDTEIGPEPTGDLAALEAAQAAWARAKNNKDQRGRELGAAGADLKRESEALGRAESADHEHPARDFADRVNAAQRALHAPGHQCPTCEQPWKRDHGGLLQELELAESARRTEMERLAAARIARIDALRDLVKAKAEAVAAATRADAEAAAALTLAAASMEEAKAATAAITGWKAARRVLGPRPADPVAAVQPDGERPTSDEQEHAERDLEAAKRAETRLEQRRSDLEVGRRALDRAERALVDAEAEVARLEVLVEAIRRAPSEALRRGLDALGNLGPVRIVLREGGGAVVEVDGRPWDRASTGRQIVADVWLRAGLRRALKASWFPLVIDQAQSVGGQPLPRPGVCIVLTTTDGALAVAPRELTHA